MWSFGRRDVLQKRAEDAREQSPGSRDVVKKTNPKLALLSGWSEGMQLTENGDKFKGRHIR